MATPACRAADLSDEDEVSPWLPTSWSSVPGRRGVCWPPGSAPRGPLRRADRGRAGLPDRAADLPADIADGSGPTLSHDWNLAPSPTGPREPVALPRARLSAAARRRTALSGCAAGPADYDGVGRRGQPRMDVRRAASVVLRGGVRPGLPGRVARHRRPDPGRAAAARRARRSARGRSSPPRSRAGTPGSTTTTGPGRSAWGRWPRNVRDGVRMSTALTYLAAARPRPNLEIRPDTLVDRVDVAHGRARAGCGSRRERGRGGHGGPRRRHLRQPGDPAAQRDRAGRAATGARPAGRGGPPRRRRQPRRPPAGLRRPARRARPPGTGPPGDAHDAVRSRGPRGCRRTCSCSWPVPSTTPPIPSGAVFGIVTELLGPRSRGSVRLRSADPTEPPRIDPAHLRHPDDLARMVEATRDARRISRTPPLADLVLGPEINPGDTIDDDDDVGWRGRSAAGSAPATTPSAPAPWARTRPPAPS